jgi:hypothetical protein
MYSQFLKAPATFKFETLLRTLEDATSVGGYSYEVALLMRRPDAEAAGHPTASEFPLKADGA